MDIRQRIIKFAATLRKQFPERDGAYAIVTSPQPRAIVDEGFQGDPTADERPQFVKDDEIGWTPLSGYNTRSKK